LKQVFFRYYSDQSCYFCFHRVVTLFQIVCAAALVGTFIRKYLALVNDIFLFQSCEMKLAMDQ